MPANLTTHVPMIPWKTDSGNTPETYAAFEKAGQTFQIGVPVQLNAGYCQQWDGATYTAGLLGISGNFGNNIATNGLGAPTPFYQITGNQAIQTYGSVQNELSAINIALGTPITDGRTLVFLSSSDIIFMGQYDNSTGTVAANWTPTAAQIGSYFGLTFDASGLAYVDGGKVTSGTNTCVQLVDIVPTDGFTLNARVLFRFQKASQQLVG